MPGHGEQGQPGEAAAGETDAMNRNLGLGFELRVTHVSSKLYHQSDHWKFIAD